MTRYEFESVFTDELQNYIQEKIVAGFNGSSCRRRLIGFDKFCIEQKMKEPIFTAEHATKWIEQRGNESHTTQYSRINASKHFLKYLSIKGYDVVVIRDIKYKGTDFQPHIYSDTEVVNYFLAIDCYSSRMNRKDALQYPVLFRILYCCGTRINETLGIRRKDVDLEKGIILLNETKNNKQRYVIMGDDLLALINDYANKCFYLLGDEDYIFTNSNGGRVNGEEIYKNHREFLFQAGIPYIGDGKGPRIHDWRNTHLNKIRTFCKTA